MIPKTAKRITNEAGKRVWVFNGTEYACKRDLVFAGVPTKPGQIVPVSETVSTEDPNARLDDAVEDSVSMTNRLSESFRQITK
jgi:hypothetical protein